MEPDARAARLKIYKHRRSAKERKAMAQAKAIVKSLRTGAGQAKPAPTSVSAQTKELQATLHSLRGEVLHKKGDSQTVAQAQVLGYLDSSHWAPCPDPDAATGFSCISLCANDANCGACGVTCPPQCDENGGQQGVCQNGQCVYQPGALTYCNDCRGHEDCMAPAPAPAPSSSAPTTTADPACSGRPPGRRGVAHGAPSS